MTNRIQLVPFTVTPKAMHELIVMPMFGDLVDEAGNIKASEEDGDWMVMTDVVYQRPILELRGHQNILKRRDVTCKLIYSPVGTMTNRFIRTEKLYGATEDCIEEFYQGCFEDYTMQNWDIFGGKVMQIMETGLATDIYTNKYFGDISRPAEVTGTWSWNKFDGVFTQLARYVAQGDIKAAQTFNIPSGTLTPQQAKDTLEAAYQKRGALLKVTSLEDVCFYVDSNLADAYEEWLKLAGLVTMADRMNGVVGGLRYRKIEIKVKPWDAILAALNSGVEAHVCLLQLRSNFLFATDNTYGGGPRRDQAVRVWWSDDENVWRRQFHLKAGTEIVAPQYVVLGMTPIS
jgi:hypothetical protein